jgi:hypothetical protein
MFFFFVSVVRRDLLGPSIITLVQAYSRDRVRDRDLIGVPHQLAVFFFLLDLFFFPVSEKRDSTHFGSNSRERRRDARCWKGAVIEGEREEAVRTRAISGIIRSQVLCGDSECSAAERGSILRAGATGPSSGVLSEREKRRKKANE